MDYTLNNLGDGFTGVASREDVDALNKALTAGYGYTGTPGSLTGGSALMTESLEASLKSTTWQMKNLMLWPSIPVDKAYNTVEQYARITTYGGGGSPYFTEGGTPREEDPAYNRATQKIVYFGTKRKVSHPMMLVRVQFGDAVAREVNNGNMWMLQNIERELYFGNGLMSNAGAFDGAAAAIHDDSLALNGLDQQIREGNALANAKAGGFAGYGQDDSVIVDQGGDILAEDTVEKAANIILNNFGVPVEMHLSTEAVSDFSRQFFDRQRGPLGVADGKAGFVLREFVSSAGTFALKPSVFLRPKREPLSAAVNTDAAVTVAKPTAALAADGTTSFKAGEVYQYKVAAVTTAGEGAPSVAADAVTVDADGKKITLTIVNPNTTKAVIAYAVYRTTAGGSTYQFIGYVKRAGALDGAAETVFTDKNKKLPGCSEAFLLFMDADAIQFKQLAPLSKINLGTTAAAFEWLQVLYGTLIVFTPRKHVIIENIGR